jgi:hypothetical protein
MTIATTVVPPLAFTSAGVVLPQESAILEGVLTDIDTAFGGGLDKSLTTPQGQLAQSMTAIIGDANDQIIHAINCLDPNTADGRYQDAIGQIYFLTRIAGTGTVVTVSCFGAVGTVIPAGAIVLDSAGYKYYATASGTIGAGGVVSIPFQNGEHGAIPCPVNAITTIYTPVIGWESASNPSTSGVVGRLAESRAEFEARRKLSVGKNSINALNSIYAALLEVPGVADAYVIDNPTAAAVATGSTAYSIPAYSLFVCVYGGLAADVAKAIWDNKPPGCPMTGGTTYTITDTNYSAPAPTYLMKWVTPMVQAITFEISIKANPGLPSNIVQLVKNAVLSAFSGQDGGERERIGKTVYAGRYYQGIYAISPLVQILTLGVGFAPGSTTTARTIGIDQIPAVADFNILVTVV